MPPKTARICPYFAPDLTFDIFGCIIKFKSLCEWHGGGKVNLPGERGRGERKCLQELNF